MWKKGEFFPTEFQLINVERKRKNRKPPAASTIVITVADEIHWQMRKSLGKSLRREMICIVSKYLPQVN